MTGDAPDLDDVAARALAAILLDATANILAGIDGNDGAGILDLEAATGLSLDVCAGILMATSWLAGTGGLAAEIVHAGGLALDPSNDDDEATT
jgi:hypothetical protein